VIQHEIGLSALTELRLTSFKSYRNQTLPLDAMTLLIGRNGTGKSNALDALNVLARLCTGDDIREALDGSRQTLSVRGGAVGCVPFGSSEFSLGCTVVSGTETVTLDVTIATSPLVQVVFERLAVDGETVLITEEPKLESSDIVAKWSNGSTGRNPMVTFRASRLLTSQAITRIPADAGVRVHRAAALIEAAFAGVFLLEPVPQGMRNYVPERDVLLRTDASNISAAIGSLIENPAAKQQFVDALEMLNEQHIEDIAVEASRLGDVILNVRERGGGGHVDDVSARSLSDGTLRFLAILTALLQASQASWFAITATEISIGQTQLVIEELENGLHSSQAGTLLRLMREATATQRIRTLATAHSPAVLDALLGSEHRSVVVCQRDADGNSTLRRLVDLEGYVEIAAMSSLGKALTEDQIRSRPAADPEEALRFLDDLLGNAL
jgi:predicted ATPase